MYLKSLLLITSLSTASCLSSVVIEECQISFTETTKTVKSEKTTQIKNISLFTETTETVKHEETARVENVVLNNTEEQSIQYKDFTLSFELISETNDGAVIQSRLTKNDTVISNPTIATTWGEKASISTGENDKNSDTSSMFTINFVVTKK